MDEVAEWKTGSSENVAFGAWTRWEHWYAAVLNAVRESDQKRIMTVQKATKYNAIQIHCLQRIYA